MKSRILIVDDEPQILRFLKPSLEAAGYEVVTAANGTEALKITATAAPDAILLDLGLPDMDGKEVIAALRAWTNIPVIVVSARDREAEKIAALDLGADDYVNKPFAIGELLARLRATQRRMARSNGECAQLQTGGLIIDLPSRTVTLNGSAVKLTPKEFELLAMLTRNAGRVVTHKQILTAVWGPAHTEDVQYLRVFIGQLRQKLKSLSDARELIGTEAGIGYRLHADGD